MEGFRHMNYVGLAMLPSSFGGSNPRTFFFPFVNSLPYDGKVGGGGMS